MPAGPHAKFRTQLEVEGTPGNYDRRLLDFLFNDCPVSPHTELISTTWTLSYNKLVMRLSECMERLLIKNEQLLQKRGLPRPLLPTRKDVDKYRRIWSIGSKRFATSPAVLQALTTSVPPTWTEKDYTVPTRERAEIKVRLYTPNVDPGDGHPLFVMLHGGGYCLGGLDTEEITCRLLCLRLKVVVLNVDYRLAPEHPFPTGLNDSYDAVKWVRQEPTCQILAPQSCIHPDNKLLPRQWTVEKLSTSISRKALSSEARLVAPLTP